MCLKLKTAEPKGMRGSRGRREMTPKEIKKAAVLRAMGRSYQEIADIMDLSKTAVYRGLKKHER
jgi:DNA invertase Pin-like site-specific DNA recombinase